MKWIVLHRPPHLTNGCTGQISAVTFFAKTRKKAAIKNLLGEPGVMPHSQVTISFKLGDRK